MGEMSKDSDTFSQGSPLSPILYSLFINDLCEVLNALKDTPGATRLYGRLFRCLLYADDIVLFSNFAHDMGNMLFTVEQHSFRNRYRFGIAKCETISSRENFQFLLYNQPLKAVTNSLIGISIPN